MTKKTRKRTLSERLFWLMSLIIIGSMVISLFIVALPGPPAPTPTPWPTPTPLRQLSATEEPLPTTSPASVPIQTPTEPAIGPSLPTAVVTEEPPDPAPPSATPTLTATMTVTPTSQGAWPAFFAGNTHVQVEGGARPYLIAERTDAPHTGGAAGADNHFWWVAVQTHQVKLGVIEL